MTARGCCATPSSGLNQVIAYGYDAAGLRDGKRANRYAAAMAATSDYTYDNVKALTAAMAGNANNRTNWSVYDAAGRLAYSIDADGGVTGLSYDTSGPGDPLCRIWREICQRLAA